MPVRPGRPGGWEPMDAKDLLPRITVDQGVCFGKPRIRVTRIWVALVLDFLASGVKEQETLASYPSLTA